MTMQAARLDKNDVVATYSQNAPVYDIWAALTETKARRLALARAGITNGETILEVAVGTGLTFRELLRANSQGRNYGIDLTPAMLAQAGRKAAAAGAAHYELAPGDAYALAFPDDHFDLLVNNYMFDLLPAADFPRVLAEFRRVLKPAGRLLLVNMTQGERFYQRVWERLYQFNPRWLGGCRGVFLAPALAEAGFQQIERTFVSQFGFPSEIIMAVNN